MCAPSEHENETDTVPGNALNIDPNVLFVVCDDLGYGNLGCYGAEYDTPNVDRLASEGVRFTDWHANGPICSPDGVVAD